MQNDTEVFKKYQDEHGFNAVFFFHRDLTEWGQNFLVNIVRNPEWTPVYADQMCLILLRRNEQNMPIIEQHAIPESMFQVKQHD